VPCRIPGRQRPVKTGIPRIFPFSLYMYVAPIPKVDSSSMRIETDGSPSVSAIVQDLILRHDSQILLASHSSSLKQQGEAGFSLSRHCPDRLGLPQNIADIAATSLDAALVQYHLRPRLSRAGRFSGPRRQRFCELSGTFPTSGLLNPSDIQTIEHHVHR
jgi:hypothetical protein